jgi:transcriptional regulator GlxA family with amidase domain
MRSRAEPARFGIFIYDDVEPIDLGATYGVLSMAKRILPRIEAFVVAAEAGSVRLANGLTVVADYGFADCPNADVLIVCGGAGWTAQARNPATLAFLRSRKPPALLASVCTGGMILAASGSLNGRRATTRRFAVGEEKAAPLRLMRELYPEVEPVEALVVDQDAVVTGGGVSFAIDTTLHLIERLYGAAAASDVAQTIEYSVAWRANKDALESIAGVATR